MCIALYAGNGFFVGVGEVNAKGDRNMLGG